MCCGIKVEQKISKKEHSKLNFICVNLSQRRHDTDKARNITQTQRTKGYGISAKIQDVG